MVPTNNWYHIKNLKSCGGLIERVKKHIKENKNYNFFNLTIGILEPLIISRLLRSNSLVKNRL